MDAREEQTKKMRSAREVEGSQWECQRSNGKKGFREGKCSQMLANGEDFGEASGFIHKESNGDLGENSIYWVMNKEWWYSSRVNVKGGSKGKTRLQIFQNNCQLSGRESWGRICRKM